MATLVERRLKSGGVSFKVQWRQGGGRDGCWQSETFESRRAAVKFQAMVDAWGQRWPEGWIKGVGFGPSRAEP